MENKQFKFLSTFTGIGGFEIGIHNAYRNTIGRVEENKANLNADRQRLLSTQGQNISSQKGQASERTTDITDQGPLLDDNAIRGTDEGNSNDEDDISDDPSVLLQEGGQRPLCVGYSEIDKYAISTYEKHYPGAKNYGDITKINTSELPDFDCLVGGFPCQSFSIAGKRGGFSDTRGTLFFELARILQAKQPRLFVFENVKGLLSHDNGKTFRTIISAIAELGYDAQWQVINSKNFGVPQNRERVIIVGHLRGTTRPQVFPISQANNSAIRRLNTPVHSTDRIYSPKGIGPALSTMQGGGRQPYIAFGGDEAPIDPTINAAGVRASAGIPRQLDRMSDTQRYKMAGNAVTTNVIQAVFERIFSGETL